MLILFLLREINNASVSTDRVLRVSNQFDIRPLAKLNPHVKIAQPRNQIESQAVTLSSVTITLCQDFESLYKSDGISFMPMQMNTLLFSRELATLQEKIPTYSWNIQKNATNTVRII